MNHPVTCSTMRPAVDMRQWAVALALWLALSLAVPAHASSSTAWQAFRADVARSCRAVAAPSLEHIRLQIDPFGSSDYGMALLSGNAPGSSQVERVICVYDKHRQTAQIGSPLPSQPAPTSLSKPAAH